MAFTNNNAEELAKYMASDYYRAYPYRTHFSHQQFPNNNIAAAYSNTLASSIASCYRNDRTEVAL